MSHQKHAATRLSAPPLQIVLRDPHELRPHPRNARVHPKRQIRKLANAIKAVGHLVPILIDEGDVILKGHATVAAAKLLALKTVPTVKIVSLSDTQKRTFMLGDNRLAEDSGWDRRQLSTELGELAELLRPVDLDITVTGFEPPEIDMILSDHGASKPDPGDEVPPIPERPTTLRGDFWSLGEHRILCGDARSTDDLDKLMGGERARMAFVDAPYNLSIEKQVRGRGKIRHKEFAFASGEMGDGEFTEFLRQSFANIARVSRDGAIVFASMDWRHLSPMLSAGLAAFAEMKNLVVWNKSSPGQGSFYRSQHELIFVWKVGESPHINAFGLGQNGRMRSNVWTYSGMNSFRAGRADDLASHPTIKPLALVADAMRDCSMKGDIVLDVFLGSGTTVMAAERVGRRGFALEYEPRYVDVAIRRWQKYTRMDAILLNDGRTFEEIAIERGSTAPRLPSSAGQADHTVAAVDETPDWVALCGSPPDVSWQSGK